MQKGIVDSVARAMKKDIEKGYSEKMDKDKDHVERRQRDEGDATWQHRPQAKPPPPPPWLAKPLAQQVNNE
jgi:hypothetical protein